MSRLEDLFFLSGTSIVNPMVVESIFHEGLYNKTNNIFSTMMQVDTTLEDIELKAGMSGYDVVYVVRIPKMFMMPTLVDDKFKEAPLPIWKKVDGRYYLSNELIYGVYYNKTCSFVYNDNYKEIPNPAGLLYDRKQEEYFKEHNFKEWTDFSTFRKQFDYTTLMNRDINNHIWDRFIKRYQKYIGENNFKK